MTYEDFISRFEKRTPTKHGVQVRCPAHDDGTASLSVGRANDGGVLLHCFAKCPPESVVSALGLEMKDLFAKESARPFTPPAPPPTVHRNGETTKAKPVIETTYSYTDEIGRELYQVVRMKPKDFRQRHKVDDKWIWSMDGVDRVLYRLPEVSAAKEVRVCEGEKDCDNLAAFGLVATCNVGGAGKWLNGYTDTLKGKHVVLYGDNDKAGREHIEMVYDSIKAKAASVKIIKLPTVYKDVSDLIADRGDKAKEMLVELEAAAVPHIGGTRMPVYSLAQAESGYRAMINKPQDINIKLSDWLPSLRGIRPLTPGTLVLFVGKTGIGKTMILQNIAMSALRVKTILFSMELSQEDVFERFMAIKNKCECVEVEQEYRNNGPVGPEALMKAFPHLYICPEGRITLQEMEAIILKADLKMGGRPVLVLVDYVQLIQGGNESRYERLSNTAEGLKALAKTTQTIVIVASQVGRESAKEGGIVGLHSGKDSGGLENSAGIVIGATRDDKDKSLLHLKVLKSTKGGAGCEVKCNIDGAKATITERAPQYHHD